jgi:hypothetical protein
VGSTSGITREANPARLHGITDRRHARRGLGDFPPSIIMELDQVSGTWNRGDRRFGPDADTPRRRESILGLLQ